VGHGAVPAVAVALLPLWVASAGLPFQGAVLESPLGASPVVVEGHPFPLTLGVGQGGRGKDDLPQGVSIRLCVGLRQHDDADSFEIHPVEGSLRCEPAVEWLNGSAVLAWRREASQVQLTGLAVGRHVAWAVLYDTEQQHAVGEAQVLRFHVVPRVLDPSYEWQGIADGQEVPAGLEVHMDLWHDSRRRARIPPSWRLQLWVAPASRFFRQDVTRTSSILWLRESVASFLELPVECVTFRVSLGNQEGGQEYTQELDDAATAETARLFQRQRDLTLEVAGRETCKVPPRRGHLRSGRTLSSLEAPRRDLGREGSAASPSSSQPTTSGLLAPPPPPHT